MSQNFSVSSIFVENSKVVPFREEFQRGDLIVAKGDDSDCIYYLESGTIQVTGSRSLVYAELGPGSFFGEVGLIYNVNRTAAVKAKEPCVIYTIMPEEMDFLTEAVKNKIYKDGEERHEAHLMRLKMGASFGSLNMLGPGSSMNSLSSTQPSAPVKSSPFSFLNLKDEDYRMASTASMDKLHKEEPKSTVPAKKEEPIIQKTSTQAVSTSTTIKKEEPPAPVKKEPVVAKKNEPSVSSAPAPVKKDEPVIAKKQEVPAPIKKDEPVVAKKQEVPAPIKKDEPAVAKKQEPPAIAAPAPIKKDEPIVKKEPTTSTNPIPSQASTAKKEESAPAPAPTTLNKEGTPKKQDTPAEKKEASAAPGSTPEPKTNNTNKTSTPTKEQEKPPAKPSEPIKQETSIAPQNQDPAPPPPVEKKQQEPPLPAKISPDGIDEDIEYETKESAISELPVIESRRSVVSKRTSVFIDSSKLKIPLSEADIRHFEIFANLEDAQVAKVDKLLKKKEMKSNEYVLQVAEKAESMFFLVVGQIEVISEFGELIDSAKGPTFFGEVGILEKVPRTANIKTKSPCTLYEISMDDLYTLFNDEELVDVKDEIERVAKERLQDHLMRNILA